MFTPIRSILPEAVNKNGMAPKVARARIFTLFEEAARTCLSGEAEGVFKVLRFTDGTVTVACRTSAIALRLRAHEAILLEAMKEAGAERIRFLLSPWR